MLAMLSNHLCAHAAAESKDAPVPASAEAPIRHAQDMRPVLDAASLGRLTELDPTGENRLLERVLQAFQVSVARLCPQLAAARQCGDRAPIRLVVHTLKSSSASIGALRLSQQCAQIETAIRLEADADLSDLLDAFDRALDDVLRAIDTLLKDRT